MEKAQNLTSRFWHRKFDFKSDIKCELNTVIAIIDQGARCESVETVKN